MKDQNGNKITEHEFTKDIGHRTEMTKTIEGLFEEYAIKYDLVNNYEVGTKYDERMQEIIQEVTKQIQSDLLKEIEHNLKSQFRFTRDMSSKEDYNRGIEKSVKIIKKLAEAKEILIN